MKLWKLSQDDNNGYDTYDSAIVAAETEEEARGIHPGSDYFWENGHWTCFRTDGSKYVDTYRGVWTSPDRVTVEYIGEAKQGTKKGTICASFNAG